jgi:hypothetical protein
VDENASAKAESIRAEYGRLDLMKISALITPETALSTESAYAAIQVEPH